MATTYTRFLYHLVFSTKHRAPLITPELRDPLYAYIGGIVRDHRGVLMAAGGMPDHVHLLVNLRAVPSVAEHLQVIKGGSSRWINDNHPQLGFAWQTGYGGFTVSESSVPEVMRYIANQEAHHQRMTFKEELVRLLKRHGIEYDERYLLD